MLQRDDADVVRRDPRLPGLGVLLDPDRLLAALVAATGASGLGGLTVEYLRYKRGQSCLAACRARLNGRDLVFTAKAYRPDARDKLRKSVDQPAVPGPLGAGRFVLEAGVTVSVFPNDRRLSMLASLTASDVYARVQKARGGDRVGPDHAASIEPLRYNPERRFVGRLVVNDENVAAVRCYLAADALRAAACVNALRSRGSLRLARPLARLKAARVVVLEWLDGELLHDAMARHRVSRDTLRSVGVALAELHAQEAHGLPVRSPQQDALALRAIAEDVALVCPRVAVRVRALAAALIGRLADSSVAPRPLHGDFYARQVLLQHGGVAFVDLDEASWGHPAIDLARFIADLDRAVISGGMAATQAVAHAKALTEGYGDATGGLPGDLDVHVAAQLMRLAPHPFRGREAGWTEKTVAILDRAAVVLERRATAKAPARSASPRRQSSNPAVTDAFDADRDAGMPFLVEALAPAQMARHFTREFRGAGRATRVEVRSVAVTRHKPGRRCLVEYELALHGVLGAPARMTVIGKARARGADATTHRLVEALWSGSFGRGATDGILVPEPICVVPAVHMTVQCKVPGEPIWARLAGPDGVSMARRAAEAIAKLHRVFVPPTRRHPVAAELAVLRARLAEVACVQPSWRQRLGVVLEGCSQLAARADGVPTCGVHRDFYPDQLLSDGERVWLVDLDLYSEGDPALDVGNFAAHLLEYGLRQGRDARRWADTADAFVARYHEVGEAVTADSVRTWTTLSLARHIWISTRFDDRRPTSAVLLAACEERLFGSLPHPAGSTASAAGELR